MTAKNEIVRRIRAALRDVPAGETPAQTGVDRDYRQRGVLPHAVVVEQLVDRLLDYKAAVRQVSAAELPAAIAAALSARNARRMVVPADLPPEWLPPEVTALADHGLSYAELDAADGVVTGCALAVAQTGTIILDGGAYQGRRAITLVPDYHLCIVRTDQVVEIVPEAIGGLHRAAVEQRRPITLISGPSATSDIELNRVEGVHGPRTLEVIIVG